MSMNLITGHAGMPHVTSVQQGACNAAVFSKGRYVLNIGSEFTFEILSNNLIRVNDGLAINQGRFMGIDLDNYEEMTIDNGLQGVKRTDLIVIHYEKNAETGIETATMKVIKGASGNEYADPEHVAGNILNGDLNDDFLLYRVKIDGLNIDSVEPLFKIKKPADVMEVADNTISFIQSPILEKLLSGEKLSIAFGKIAKVIVDFMNHVSTAASAAVSGHVKFGTVVGTACQGNDSRLTNSRTPVAHASAATTYGVGNASNYGHVKLSDTYTSSVGAAAAAIGASQAALYNAYDVLNKRFNSYLPLAGGTVSGTLVLSKATDASGTANTSPALIVGGTAAGVHLELDNNEIQGKSNGTTPNGISINKDGGDVYIGKSADNYTCTVRLPTDFLKSVTVGGRLSTQELYIGGGWITALHTNSNGSYSTLRLLGMNNHGNIHMGDYNGANESPVYLHAAGGGYGFLGTMFRPDVTNTLNLGDSSHLWKALYAKTGTINTSDRTKKHDIRDISEVYERLFLSLKPKSFMFDDGDRVHIGAISQDVEDAMTELGIEPEQFAGFCKDIQYKYTEFNEEDNTPIESSKVPCTDENGNPVYDYALRYQEFIFLTVHMTQRLWERADSLEEENLALKARLDDLEAKVEQLLSQ